MGIKRMASELNSTFPSLVGPSYIFLYSLFFLDILDFFKGRRQTPLVFSVNLVFDQPAVKPAGLDRFFP
jgi:hypothetical protein